MTEIYSLHAAESPVLISVPHAGQKIPRDIGQRLTDAGRALPDTDWYVDRLYGFATGLGASLLVAHYSRYVIDLNRPPDDQALYATRTTGLVPLETFAGAPLYRPGLKPDAEDISDRTIRYWQPWHRELETRLQATVQRYGFAVLLEAHSILSEVPALFEGVLPHLNLGSYDGRSAAPDLVGAVFNGLASHSDYDVVLDGRFKGGFTTRHYGRPADGIHALQLEMAQRVYMQEMPPAPNAERAGKAQKLLRDLVNILLHWKPGHE